MFLRTKVIKGSTLVQLVESYRNAEGQPRQRVIVSLGDISVPDSKRKAIARSVEMQLRGQDQLIPINLSEEGSGLVTRIIQLAGRAKRSRAQ